MALHQTPQHKRVAELLRTGRIFRNGNLEQFHAGLVASVKKYNLQGLFKTELEMFPPGSEKAQGVLRASQLLHEMLATIISEMGNPQAFGAESNDLDKCAIAIARATTESGYPIPLSVVLATIARVQPDVSLSTLAEILHSVDLSDDEAYVEITTLLEGSTNSSFLEHVKSVRQALEEKSLFETSIADPSTSKNNKKI